MSPGANTQIPWPWGQGFVYLRAIQAVFFNLEATGDAAGAWSGLAVAPLYDLIGPSGYGTPENGGAVLANIQAGQFPPTQNSVNLTNPVVQIWQGMWTPQSYEPRTVQFNRQNGSANPNAFPSYVIIRDPEIPSTIIVGTAYHSGGSFQIPIVPAPATIFCLGLVGIAGGTRRRR